MEYSQTELDNLERLLTSPVQANTELALQLMANDTALVVHFKKYLLIVATFSHAKSVYEVVVKLLEKTFEQNITDLIPPALKGFFDFNFWFKPTLKFAEQLPFFESFKANASTYDVELSKMPHFSPLFYKLGNYCETHYKAYDWAIYFHQKATQYNLKAGASYFKIGFVYMRFLMKVSEELFAQEAIQAFQQAFQCEYFQEKCAYNIGVIYDIYSTQPQNAEFYYKKALELAPNYNSALNNLGYLYLKQQQYDRAKPFIEKALKNAPYDHYILSSMGEWYMRATQDYDKAKMYLQKAIRQQPNFAFHHLLLGDLYLDGLQLPLEANLCYLKVQALEPYHKRAWARLQEIKENYDL